MTTPIEVYRGAYVVYGMGDGSLLFICDDGRYGTIKGDLVPDLTSDAHKKAWKDYCASMKIPWASFDRVVTKLFGSKYKRIPKLIRAYLEFARRKEQLGVEEPKKPPKKPIEPYTGPARSMTYGWIRARKLSYDGLAAEFGVSAGALVRFVRTNMGHINSQSTPRTIAAAEQIYAKYRDSYVPKNV